MLYYSMTIIKTETVHYVDYVLLEFTKFYHNISFNIGYHRRLS